MAYPQSTNFAPVDTTSLDLMSENLNRLVDNDLRNSLARQKQQKEDARRSALQGVANQIGTIDQLPTYQGRNAARDRAMIDFANATEDYSGVASALGRRETAPRQPKLEQALNPASGHYEYAFRDENGDFNFTGAASPLQSTIDENAKYKETPQQKVDTAVDIARKTLPIKKELKAAPSGSTKDPLVKLGADKDRFGNEFKQKFPNVDMKAMLEGRLSEEDKKAMAVNFPGAKAEQRRKALDAYIGQVKAAFDKYYTTRKANGNNEPPPYDMGGGSGGGAAQSTQTPLTNSKGWKLHKDAKGNQAYVSPDGTQFEEVK